jgi:muramoyltetrapeptide carboxypeptidase
VNIPPIGIAIVAPGGYAPDNAAFLGGIARLEAQGCTVHNYYDYDTRFQRFGGTDEARLAQLHAAARDPDVQVVMALRGSYGMSRLLPHIDYQLLADSGKIFVGFSDMTAFHMALMAKTGACSYAGPMASGDFGVEVWDEYTLQNFFQCLAGPTHMVSGQATGNPVLDVSGKLWGGNLAMVTHLCGTEYFPNTDGGILFLEDVNEHPFRVERMMLQLLFTGVLQKQEAIILGDFGNYALVPADNGYDFDAMLAFIRTQTSVPILTGLPFGHISTRATLPFGAQARLRSTASGFQLLMSDYPTLSNA